MSQPFFFLFYRIDAILKFRYPPYTVTILSFFTFFLFNLSHCFHNKQKSKESEVFRLLGSLPARPTGPPVNATKQWWGKWFLLALAFAIGGLTLPLRTTIANHFFKLLRAWRNIDLVMDYFYLLYISPHSFSSNFNYIYISHFFVYMYSVFLWFDLGVDWRFYILASLQIVTKSTFIFVSTLVKVCSRLNVIVLVLKIESSSAWRTSTEWIVFAADPN